MIDIYIQNASIQNDGYESHTSCQKKCINWEVQNIVASTL